MGKGEEDRHKDDPDVSLPLRILKVQVSVGATRLTMGHSSGQIGRQDLLVRWKRRPTTKKGGAGGLAREDLINQLWNPDRSNP